MTNPNNAIGTNGAFGGRTSVNAFNDIMGAFQSRGILSGWGIVPSSGMTVSIGGDGTTRDVAIAEDAIGNKTSVNNISGAPISVTLNSAPASNSRYDAIVAYVDKPPIGNATQDNPECCGIIPVTGTAASTPAYPADAAIRSAITADGASGATAYYVVLGYVLVASGTTTITSGMITAGLSPTTNAMVDTAHIQDGAVTSQKIDSTTFGSLVLVTPLNQSKSWSGGGEYELLSGSITTSGSSKVCIIGAVAVRPTNSGVRAMIRVDGELVQNTVYSAELNTYITLIAPVIKTLSAGTHTIRLLVGPDGFSTAAGTARDYSLVAFEL